MQECARGTCQWDIDGVILNGRRCNEDARAHSRHGGAASLGALQHFKLPRYQGPAAAGRPLSCMSSTCQMQHVAFETARQLTSSLPPCLSSVFEVHT